MTVGQTILLNLSCSVAASLVFLYLVLILFKPKIGISKFIVYNSTYADDPGEVHYYIKIVNYSLFSAYDVKVELTEQRYYPTPPTGSLNKRLKPIELPMNYMQHLPPYRPKWIRKEAAHCMRFRADENLLEIVQREHSCLRFQVLARHGLTGLVKVFHKEYSDKIQVKAGQFKYGTRFGVLE